MTVPPPSATRGQSRFLREPLFIEAWSRDAGLDRDQRSRFLREPLFIEAVGLGLGAGSPAGRGSSGNRSSLRRVALHCLGVDHSVAVPPGTALH